MKNLYCVVSDEKIAETKLNIQNIKVAIFICLYYEEQVIEYKEYIKEIPDFIDVYIISSKDIILKSFDSKRFHLIKKENRGRDISALLVSAKPMIFQYEYVCYIHDKKEKSLKMKGFTDLWKKNLWDNMLGSKAYIQNVLELFESEQKLGMLAPLPPHKGDVGAWLFGGWGNNLENTKKLADQLGLMVPILNEKPPFALSTVFWVRAKVLKKLFEKEWDYCDFPEEPLKDDGEINHAVERILQFIVEDAGYETKIVVSSSFASIFFQQMHDELQYLWENLNQLFGIRNYDSLQNYQNKSEQVARFFKKYDHVFLYGAGKRGMNCISMCRILDVIPEKILVTSLQDNEKAVEEIPVVPVEQFIPGGSVGVIITVGQAYQEEVIYELESRGCLDYMIF